MYSERNNRNRIKRDFTLGLVLIPILVALYFFLKWLGVDMYDGSF